MNGDANFPVAKVILLGDAGVGKSSLLRAFCDLPEPPGSHHQVTTNIDRQSRYLNDPVRNIKLKAEFWDVGADYLMDHSARFFPNTLAALILYDITRPETFRLAREKYFNLATKRSPACVIMFVGCKTDLSSQRQVSIQEGEQFAAANSAFFMEVSAHERTNIDLSLKILRIRMVHIYRQMQRDNEEDSEYRRESNAAAILREPLPPQQQQQPQPQPVIQHTVTANRESASPHHSPAAYDDRYDQDAHLPPPPPPAVSRFELTDNEGSPPRGAPPLRSVGAASQVSHTATTPRSRGAESQRGGQSLMGYDFAPSSNDLVPVYGAALPSRASLGRERFWGPGPQGANTSGSAPKAGKRAKSAGGARRTGSAGGANAGGPLQMQIEVLCPNGEVGIVNVSEGDNAYTLAQAFVSEHGLRPRMVQKLAVLIQEQVAAYTKQTLKYQRARYQKMTKRRTKKSSKARQELTDRATRHVLFRVILELSNGRRGAVVAREGDSLWELATNFVRQHSLAPEKTKDVFKLLKAQYYEAAEEVDVSSLDIQKGGKGKVQTRRKAPTSPYGRHKSAKSVHLFNLDIDCGPAKGGRVRVYSDSNPHILASKFGNIHKLTHPEIEKIAQLIETNMDIHNREGGQDGISEYDDLY